MNLRRIAAAPALIALAAGLIALWGCNKKPTVPIVGGNQPPTVRITSAPYDTSALNYYVITINWIGFDPDGRVDHFLLAIDPPKEPGQDTLWESTTANTTTRSFPCPLPDRPDSTISSDFHVFVIKAVDNQGAHSPPVVRAFWSYTLAPSVQITVPRANSLVTYYVPPSVLFQWEGRDEDGVFTQKPVKYKFKLLDENTEVALIDANLNPDLVRQYYAPRHWAGWDSLPGDTTLKQFSGLTPDRFYMLVVVAFDEAGAYTPLFSRFSNMLLFKVTFAGAQNPRITFYNDFFFYEYEQGSYQPNNPLQTVFLEVPADDPEDPNDRLTFNWFANPASDRLGNPVGGPIRTYRWAVDIVNLEDETRRTDDETDLVHWSQKTDAITSCRIGPYPGGEIHKFYLEAEDINNLVSIGVIQFTTVLPSFDKQLLIVDDTRYVLDKVSPGTNCYSSVNRPFGKWPLAAELDTFLYAKGGMPWKCYPPAPPAPPLLSTPGIFNGYDFDTLGTNFRTPDLTVKLSKLSQYRHVIWLVDGQGAQNFRPGTDPGDLAGPLTSLRYMNSNQKANTLGTYVRQGGKVWLAGGGAATASIINYNRTTNDTQLPVPATVTFVNAPSPLNELVPGRFIYEQGHWRSEFKQYTVQGKLLRYLGRFQSTPGKYADLPVEINLKSSGTDPFPPNRATSPASNFYQQQFDVEFLSVANEIIEDMNPGPGERFESMLDTLYKVTASTIRPDTGRDGIQSVVMTSYHGLDNELFIVTGFNFWNFRRAHCKALVDFVLQKMWNFSAPVQATANLARPARAHAVAGGLEGEQGAPAGARAAPSRRVPTDGTPASGGSRD